MCMLGDFEGIHENLLVYLSVIKHAHFHVYAFIFITVFIYMLISLYIICPCVRAYVAEI